MQIEELDYQMEELDYQPEELDDQTDKLDDVMNRLIEKLAEFCSQGQSNEAQALVDSFLTRLAEAATTWEGNGTGYVPTLFDWEPQPYIFKPGEPVDPTKFDITKLESVVNTRMHPTYLDRNVHKLPPR